MRGNIKYNLLVVLTDLTYYIGTMLVDFMLNLRVAEAPAYKLLILVVCLQ